MPVTSYGLFWDGDAIEWFPGSGRRNEFQILGRVGADESDIKIADFRHQRGVYVLCDGYEPVYAGQSCRLGARIKTHRENHLGGKWDRFSWFGFDDLTEPPGSTGIRSELVKSKPQIAATPPAIGDLEAIMIAAFRPRYNRIRMRFHAAQEWEQVTYWEWKDTYEKLAKKAIDR